ncbi:MAG: hypothetical protein ACRD7E_30525 [Bryobacteraceae bacterium]
MIVYANRSEIVRTAELLDEIRSSLDNLLVSDLIAQDVVLDVFIRFAQLEPAIADSRCPQCDDIDPALQALHEVSTALAQALLRNAAVRESFQSARRSLEKIAPEDLPEHVSVKPLEGYAYYALYPKSYAEAAHAIAQERDPPHSIVIGIRSIGVSLASVVVAALQSAGRSAESFTVRPHGHPFDRELRLSPRLEEYIRARTASFFLVVDEGPGLSGSSFTSVVRKLEQLGVPRDGIALIPSHEADSRRFVSSSAREYWTSLRKVLSDSRPPVPASSRDLSAGKWRELLFDHEDNYPAVDPHHERLKYLHNGELWKFAGLGHFGKPKLDRALRLFDAGFCPKPIRYQDGFLILEFADGEPLLPQCVISTKLLKTLAEYLAYISDRFATARPVPYAALVEMIRINTGLECPAENPVIEQRTTTAIDGRMLPHEWLSTDDGYRKTDALDHHDDHFFPGCQDIAWDLAGAAIEFRLEPDAREELLERFLFKQEDRTLSRRLDFYMAAYLAYRIGYAKMAVDSLSGTAEATRFQELHVYYSEQLQIWGSHAGIAGCSR